MHGRPNTNVPLSPLVLLFMQSDSEKHYGSDLMCHFFSPGCCSFSCFSCSPTRRSTAAATWRTFSTVLLVLTGLLLLSSLTHSQSDSEKHYGSDLEGDEEEEGDEFASSLPPATTTGSESYSSLLGSNCLCLLACL